MNHLEAFKNRLKEMTDEKLLDAYEKDREKRVGITAHLEFLRALREEFESRGYIYPTLVKNYK